MAVPLGDPIEEIQHIIRKNAEEAFALFRRGEVRAADMARSSAVLGDPGAVGGFEGVAEGNGRKVFPVTDEIRMEAENHGCLPLAGMAHFGLGERRVEFAGFRTEQPISCEEQEEILFVAIFLAEFESGLSSGNVIAAMAIEKDNAAETVVEEILREIGEEVEVGARRGRERAGKIEVVMGIAQPEQGGKESAFFEGFPGPADNFTQQHAISEEGQMAAMLLEGRDGYHHGDILPQSANFRCGEMD